jgi:TetR/AcrR family transcriptional regulator, regulator of autoinduction and epiphytic fitness
MRSGGPAGGVDEPRVESGAKVERVDGRLARGERARAAVGEALLALFAEGELSPSAPRIAQRAGVSQRLLYHHFADLEALFDAVAQRQLERMAGLIQLIPRDLPLDERLRRLVEQRAALFELIAPVRRAALLHEHQSQTLNQQLQVFRAFKRAQLADVLAAELQAFSDEARAETVAALGAAASWSCWEALRAHQGLDVAQASRVLTRTLRALLLSGDGLCKSAF